MSKFAAMQFIEISKPVRMHILIPWTTQRLVDRDGKEAYLDLYSSDSPVGQRFQLDITESRLRNPRTTAEKLLEERNAHLAAQTAGWHLVGKNFEPIDIPFSTANATELYGEMVWLREQAENFIADRRNFALASSNN